MNKYLWILLSVFLVSCGFAVYAILNINPLDYFPWAIVGGAMVLFSILFSFFSLFFFFLTELYQKDKASLCTLKHSMRRAVFVALWGVFFSVLNILGLAELVILWGGVLFFIFLEIYYSFLVRR